MSELISKEYKLALDSKLMLNQDSIDSFRKFIENLDINILNSYMIKDFYLLLDDNTEHTEIMFSVVQCIEYICMKDIKNGIKELTCAMSNNFPVIFDWAETLLGRILGNEKYVQELICSVKKLNIENKIKILALLVCLKEKNKEFIPVIEVLIKEVI
jgi:hypothetical protein